MNLIQSKSVLQINRLCHRSLRQIGILTLGSTDNVRKSIFTAFPVLSVDYKVGIYRSASETDECLFFYM